MRLALAWLLAALALAGCGDDGLTPQEKAVVASMSLSRIPPLPPDPTNRFADQPGPAAFGATLFFETRMSRSGDVACATCHVIDRQFQDDRPFGKATGETRRRTMPLADVARNAWFFWDGRRDSLWAQALTPLEDPLEHAGTRTGFMHVLATHLKDRYEHVFGPLPDVAGLPAQAGPLGTPEERTAWAALPPERRRAIDTVFANLGKAIAAFERTIVHQPTRFDRFADAIAAERTPEGDAALSREEETGLRLFIGKARCFTCHTGPLLTDGHFHNTGVPAAAGKPVDRGRAEAIAQVESDPFNCQGAFRDGGPEACGELRFMVREGPTLVRAYKTPSLRGVAGRPPYMHAGQFPTLEAVVDHYVRAPPTGEGHSEVKPLRLTDRERKALVAFLRTLGE